MGAGQSQEKGGFSDRDIVTENLKNAKKIKGLAKVMSVKEKKVKESKEMYRVEDDYEMNKTNQQLLKNLFKKMDPMVMKVTGDVKGEVQLSLKYDFKRELLLIKAIRCRDLDPKDVRGKAADPYLKMVLLPRPEDEDAERRTQVVRRTLAPIYNEIFSYNITELAIMEAKLVVQVCDFDDVVKDDVLGETIVHLKTFNFKEEPVHTAWYTLQLETDLDITGSLAVSLSYRLPHTLVVTLHSGTDLTQRDPEVKPDTSVKVLIPGVRAVHTTKVVVGTQDPEWQETFEFPVPQEEFSFRYLIFNVYDQTSEMDSGQVFIDLMNFDPDKGFIGHFDLGDLKNHDRLRNKMSQKATVQEFKEALMAHSLFRQPHFLFQKHSENKVITVTSRKAGTKAKIRMVDGIPVY